MLASSQGQLLFQDSRAIRYTDDKGYLEIYLLRDNGLQPPKSHRPQMQCLYSTTSISCLVVQVMLVAEPNQSHIDPMRFYMGDTYWICRHIRARILVYCTSLFLAYTNYNTCVLSERLESNQHYKVPNLGDYHYHTP